MITRSNEHLDGAGMPSVAMLKSVLKEHMAGLPRLEKLRRYYGGQNDILGRQRAKGLPNNRMAHAYARYIVAVTTGYLIGSPVAYAAGESRSMAAIQALFRRISINSVDAENARNAAIYGRGVEFIHAGGELEARISALSPMDAFVVYDDGCDAAPLFGVYCARRQRADGSDDGWRV